ncbi:MAG: phosphatidate cytidylyltransferase [Arachnia sp.]
MTSSSQTASTPTAGRNLPVAIGVGVVLFGAIAVGLFFAPWLFIGLVAVGFCLGALEVHHALLRVGMRSSAKVIITGTAVSVIGGYLVTVLHLPISPTTFIVCCLAGTMMASFVARLRLGPEDFIPDAAASALIITYIPLMGVFVPLLMAEPQWNLRTISIIVCVIAADTGAYAFGSLFGRHKMAPRISPKKTWEGLGGALGTAAAVGLAAAVWVLGQPWWVGVILGLATALSGTLGDLVESLIKRGAGLKDMSNFLPGHGGVMDRLDSMLFAVPVGWLVLHLDLAQL